MEDRENSFYAKTRKQWRSWLAKHHAAKDSVWLIMYKKESGTPSVYYAEAVEEALCFGWIDSVANKRDELSYYQFFSRRKPKSNWSKLNRERVATLTEKNLMMPKGIEMVELAKRTGTWTKLDEINLLSLPDDVNKALASNKTALDNWNKFSASSRRAILEWIANAKREETRLKRINNMVELAALNVKANQWEKEK